MDKRTRVVIIGAGFGGLNAARFLLNQPVDLLLIDRNNYHTFTPLLYQVATAGLDSSDIAYPVRSIFRRRKNLQFLLGDVVGIHTAEREVAVRTNGRVRREHYDYLIVATGSVTNYFGSQPLEQHGYGLKDLSDAITLRNHILRLFEKAAWEEDPQVRDAYLTFVVVGGGPTGLETAGALHELYNYVLKNEYRGSRSLSARVILIEATEKLLAPYTPYLQQQALQQLESIGVEVILGQSVEDATENLVRLKNGDVIHTHTLIWAAGVKGSPVGSMLEVPLQRGARIPVEPTLLVTGLERVYAIGDIAYLLDAQGSPYPQVIPVAQQQGQLAAANVARHLRGQSLQPFVYKDKGIMATIGRRRAVAWPFYSVQLTGFMAWVTWLGLHLLWLMGFRNRLTVLVNWVWNYLTYDRSVRIILERDASASHASSAAPQPSPAQTHMTEPVPDSAAQ